MNLSVITITYNEPEALQRTLRSLVPLAASPLSWELVIVDSSTALNREIIGAFPMLPVNHVSQEPKGIYPAMNAGLALARGEIVWFLNGGDELLHANVLKSAVDTLGENSNSVMLLAAAELTRGGTVQYLQQPKGGLAPMIGINRICHQALLYRRSFLEGLGRFSERYRLAADYEFHLRALHAGAKTLLFNQAIVRYDMGGQSSRSEEIFAEFALIHKALRIEGKLRGGWIHGPMRIFERARITLFDQARKWSIAPLLRKAWHRYKKFSG